MSRFTGKVAIITETRQAILKTGTPPEYVNLVLGDVTSGDVQDELVRSTVDKFGRIDILVNNAGAGFCDPEGKEGIYLAVELLDKNLDLNVRSVVELTQKARPHLAATKQGEIVNVSSIAGGQQIFFLQLMYYSMAKSALDQFTRSAAINLIPEGIRVNSVSPGAVETGIGAAAGWSEEMSNKYHRYLEKHKEMVPARVVGTPDDIANVIAFLADRKASSYIVGQSIVADGGSTLMMGMSSHDMAKILTE